MAFGGLQLYIVYTAFISPVEFPYFPPEIVNPPDFVCPSRRKSPISYPLWSLYLNDLKWSMQLELTCDVLLVQTAILPVKCSFSLEISRFPDFAAYTICFLGNPLFIIERHGASASSPAKVMEASLPKGTAVMPRKNGDEATEKRWFSLGWLPPLVKYDIFPEKYLS